MNFHEAEERYQYLKQQLQSGRLTQEAFNAELDKLQLTSPDGAWWRIRPKDGAWLRWDGSNWIPTTLPPQSSTVPAPPKKRRRWGLACAVVMLLACCCLALVAGGGYLGIRAGNFSAIQLTTMLGGEATVHIANIDDNSLFVSASELDIPDDSGYFDTIELDPFDMGSFASLQSGRYRLVFESTGNELLNLDCTMRLQNGDVVQFVAVPEGLALSREGDEVSDPAELRALTSSLCRQ